MITSHITDDRARFLAAQATQDDDGRRIPELLELLEGTADSDNSAGNAAKDYLRETLSNGKCACVTSACAQSHAEPYQGSNAYLSDPLSRDG